MKVRIKKRPDQYLEGGNVKNNITTVDRNQANIEAEHGETVVGDVNNDGYLEHMEFKGKRHSEGGVPANVAPGSFIFSDTRKLKIKDKDILENFGKNPKGNKGYTPADLAKQYDLNKFIAISKDKDADALSKRTAEMMTQNNLKKLAELAMVQESMKGMPNGIPAIAQSLMGAPSMAYGGYIPEFQVGGGFQDPTGETVYIDGIARKVKSYDPFLRTSSFNNGNTIELDNGEWLTKADWDKLKTGQAVQRRSGDINNRSTGFWDKLSETVDRYNNWDNIVNDVHNLHNEAPQQAISLSKNKAPGRTIAGNYIDKGSIINVGGKEYEAVDPFDERRIDWKGFSDTDFKRFWDDQSKGVIKVRDKKTGKVSYINGYDLEKLNAEDVVQVRSNGKPQQNGQSTPDAISKLNSAYQGDNQTADVTHWSWKDVQIEAARGNKLAQKELDERPVRNAQREAEQKAKAAPPKRTVKRPVTNTQSSAPVVDENALRAHAQKIAEANGLDVEEVLRALNQKKEGGNVEYMQRGGQKHGKGVYVPELDQSVNYQLGIDPKVAEDKGYQVRYAPDYEGDNFGRQHYDPTRQVYTTAQRSGKTYTPNLNEFYDRHKDIVDTYPGGFSQFVKDVSSEGNTPAHNTAAKFFQENYNKRYKDIYGEDYFRPGSKAADALDSKFGIYTYSAPGLLKAPPKPEVKTTLPDVKDRSFQQPQQRDGRWWLQDIANFAIPLTDDINRYEPGYKHANMQRPDYVLMDPSRQVASIKEQDSRFNTMAQNSADGNVALANILGASGESSSRAADVLSNYENQNVGIVNQAYLNNANIANTEQQYNLGQDDLYINRMATLNQNMDNAKSDRKYRQLDAYVNGLNNYQQKKLQESVITPDVFIDPISYDVYSNGHLADNRKRMDASFGFYQGDNRTSQDPYTEYARQRDASGDSRFPTFNEWSEVYGYKKSKKQEGGDIPYFTYGGYFW